MRKRRIVAGALALLLIVGFVAGALVLFSDETDENGGTSDSDLPTSDPSELLSEEDAIEASFGSIRMIVESQGAEDEKRVSVFFVSDGANEDVILHDAAACTEEYLEEGYVSASCYGFDSAEALEAAGPDPETAAMNVICWRGFYSATEDNSTGDTASDKQYAARGCPEV